MGITMIVGAFSEWMVIDKDAVGMHGVMNNYTLIIIFIHPLALI
jgi:hypothetical protein